MSTDRIGRRRTPGQARGLRPLYPRLEAGTESRAVRITMSRRAWMRWHELVSRIEAPTTARAAGRLVEDLLPDRSTDWLRWQQAKEQQLLASTGRIAG